MGLMFLIPVIVIAYLLLKPQGLQFNPQNNIDAKDILRKRFAGGEIDEETYLKMLKTINN